MDNSTQFEGRNAVLEALRAEHEVDKIFIAQGVAGSIGAIISLARQQGIVITELPRPELDKRSQTSNHQGVIAICSPVKYATLDEILQRAKDRNEDPFVVVLDNLEDPHNLGAIIRSANAAGAHGVVIGKHRSASLTPTVARTSAGAIEYTPVAKVTNISQALNFLKNKGLWIYGAAAGEANFFTEADMTGPIALVLGNEGKGMAMHVASHCDFLVSIPMHGEIPSLNVSVAGSVMMYEIVRQRRLKK
jgi:23S rRNA (guanosine2251-2'-O)-methyltransferase